MRSSSRKTPAGEKLSPDQLRVTCGIETAIFDISKYGPGGSSRCIKFGEHTITPIEFEALAGKKSVNWKVNIRIDGKPIRTQFENGNIKTCERSCTCENCEIGRKNPSNLELLIEKVYMNHPVFDLKIVKIEKEDKDIKSKKKVDETKTKKEDSNKKGQNSKLKPQEESITKDITELKTKEKLAEKNGSSLEHPQEAVIEEETEKQIKEIKEKETNGKDSDSIEGVAPLNDVRDEFCSSPDPSPRKKRSSIETPVDEILGKSDTDNKETPPIVRTKRASRKVVENTPAPVESTPVTDIDLNKEVAPLVNMPDEKIIPDEMAPIKQDPDMVKKRQQADIRSFFSPPAKEAVETKEPFETSPAKSDCSIQLIEEKESVKKVLEVDLTESPNKSLNDSLHNSVDSSPISETKNDGEKQPRQILKRSPPSITKETLVRQTRGLRLQDRTEVVKQKHQRQREESLGRDKKSVENEQSKSGRSSRQSSALGEPVTNGQGSKEGRRGRSNNQEKKDGDKGAIELNSKEKEKKDKTPDVTKSKGKPKMDKTPSESKTNGSNDKRKSTEDDELLKILKEEKNLCLSGRKRVLREANKVDGDEEIKIISEIKPTQRRAKRKLSENGITAELEKSSPVPEKKEQEPPFKRQRRIPRDENTSSNNSKAPEPVVPTSATRRAPKEEKENANTNKISVNGVVESKEATAAARKTRKASKDEQPAINPSNDLNKVPMTAKQNKESDDNIRIDNKELNKKKELTVIESEIPKPTFIGDENGNNDAKVSMSNGDIEKEVDEIKPELNGENDETVKLEFNDNKVSPNKLPTYTTMIRSALEEMNVIGGEGCSKLEILLYILRKFRPKGNVNTITTKLIKVLEIGTKKGDFLSSVSCPRVLKKAVEEKKYSKDEDKKKEKEKKQKVKEKEKLKKIKTKDGKIIKIKASKLKKKEKEGKDKEKTKDKTKDKKEKKEKRVVIQSPRKLKEPLSTICKAKKLTRHEVVKKIWAYIHAKKLQDPTDKTVINCDENLKKLTKVKQIQQKSLMGYIKPFMEPIK